MTDPRAGGGAGGGGGPGGGVGAPGRRVEPRATYRLQLNADFPFAEAERLVPYLARLGMSHLYLSPILQAAPGSQHGYDVVDPRRISEALGGEDGFESLAAAARAAGLGLVVDIVPNHLSVAGEANPWWWDVLENGAASPYAGHFDVEWDHPEPHLRDRVLLPVLEDHYGRVLEAGGIRLAWDDDRFTVAHGDERFPVAPDSLAPLLAMAAERSGSPEVAFLGDALRLDAVHAIVDLSAVHFLEELAAAVHGLGRELGRRLVVIAESDLNDPRLVRDPDAGGYGLDAQWDDDFRHALHVGLTGERHGYHAQYAGLPDLAYALRHVFVYDGRYSAYRERRHGRRAAEAPADRFVGFLQNHDQAGDRALGERSSHLMTAAQLRIGAALALLGPFVPLLFQGEEWASSSPFLYFTDHSEPTLAQAVREGRRAEFGALIPAGAAIPDPQSAETFGESRLDWSEPARDPHAGILDWHRRLIALRRGRPDLRDGRRPQVTDDPDGRWLVMRRGEVVVAAVLGPDPSEIELDGSLRIELASDDAVTLRPGSLHLPGWSVAVLLPR